MGEPTSVTLEVVITEWPTNGRPPKVITQPWRYNFRMGRHQRNSYDYPLTEQMWDGLRLDLADLVPADPGWLAGSVTLYALNGTPLCTERPVRFYGRPSDTPTHIYIPSSAHHPSAYSVALRVTNGGLADD